MSELCCSETAEYWREEYEKLARAKDMIEQAKSGQIKNLKNNLSGIQSSRDRWKEKYYNLLKDYQDIAARIDEYNQTHMLLPVDADGVPIRPGDRVTDESGVAFTVGYVAEDMVCTGTGAQTLPYQCHHVKPDTIESVLLEWSKELLHRYSHNEFAESPDAIEFPNLTEYAERIRACCGVERE